MGEVARALEDLEAASGHELMRPPAVFDRDHAIALTPHDQQRQLGREVEPIGRAYALAGRIDARSQCLDECGSCLCVAKRGMAARDLTRDEP